MKLRTKIERIREEAIEEFKVTWQQGSVSLNTRTSTGYGSNELKWSETGTGDNDEVDVQPVYRSPFGGRDQLWDTIVHPPENEREVVGSEYLVVALLPEDAAAVNDSYPRLTEI